MKKLKRTITGLILLLCFFMTNGGTEGLVLCFGKNGHMAVETSHKGVCEASFPLKHDVSVRKHKSPCIDLALSIGRLEQLVPSKSLETVITAPVAAIASDRFSLQLNRAEPEFFILPTPATNTSIEYLRTVILLV